MKPNTKNLEIYKVDENSLQRIICNKWLDESAPLYGKPCICYACETRDAQFKKPAIDWSLK